MSSPPAPSGRTRTESATRSALKTEAIVLALSVTRGKTIDMMVLHMQIHTLVLALPEHLRTRNGSRRIGVSKAKIGLRSIEHVRKRYRTPGADCAYHEQEPFHGATRSVSRPQSEPPALLEKSRGVSVGKLEPYPFLFGVSRLI